MLKKSTFKVLFYLKTNQPNKKGEVSIVTRITIDSQSTTFSTKLFVHPSDWNKKTGRAVVSKNRKNSETVSRINRLLNDLEVKIQKLYDKYCDEQGFALPKDIKNSILGKEEKSNLSLITVKNI
ncbi:MAG: hypothetical protein LUE98_15470 [Tannerellaceae bacterium]|nr:hypothetical protein [Tannerellaceae bacterium]